MLASRMDLVPSVERVLLPMAIFGARSRPKTHVRLDLSAAPLDDRQLRFIKCEIAEPDWDQLQKDAKRIHWLLSLEITLVHIWLRPECDLEDH